MKTMLAFEDALEEILSALSPLPAETVPLADATGLVLAADVTADIDMPPFDRSAVDGYALAGGSGRYELVGVTSAGEEASGHLDAGEAVAISTGAPVPPGADRILMIEQSSSEGTSVLARRVPGEGEGICRKAEDIRRGDQVLRAGITLTPWRCGIAAMAGAASVSVFRKPLVALLTTGAEVVPFETRPGPSQVRNANLPMLGALVSSCGFNVCGSIHVRDDLAESARAVSALLSKADALIVAGGISMGDRDYVAPALQAAGVEFAIRDVAIKPGKPFAFGVRGRKAVFALPGNPVSVLCTFEELALPGLRRLSGFRELRRARLPGAALFRHSQKPGRTNLLRVRAFLDDSGWQLEMPASSGSGDLMSTRDANAIAIVPREDTSVEPGRILHFSFFASSGCSPCFE